MAPVKGLGPVKSLGNDNVKIVNPDHHEFGFTWERTANSDSSVVHQSGTDKSVVLSFDQGGPNSYMKQVQFKSLRDILDGLDRRRSIHNGDSNHGEIRRRDSEIDEEHKRLHTSIQRIEKRLIELYKEGGKNRTEEKSKKIKELESELGSLRAKIIFYEKFDDAHIRITTVRRLSNNSAPDLESDKGSEGDIEFVDPSELDFTPDDLIPSGARLSISSIKPVSSSTLFVPDPCQEQQTEQFENAIAELSEQLAHTKSALGVIKIELANLGFSEASTESWKAILTTIRHTFRQARIEFQDLFPEQHIEGVKNSAFMSLVLEHVRGILARMEEQVLRIQHQEEAIALYRAEYNGVLHKLSESEGHRVHLEEAEKQLKVTLEKKERQLVSIEKEIHQFSTRLEKQQLSEFTFTTELSWLQDILTKLEQKYVVILQKLRKEKEEAVATMKTKIEKERSAKESAVREVSEKQVTITELKKSLSTAKESAQSLQKRIDIETKKFQSAESRFEKKSQYTVKLEEKLKIEQKNTMETEKKLEIAKEALNVQRQQNNEEMSAEVEKRRRLEVQLTEVTNELSKTRNSHKRHEERISSLNGQLQASKDHSKSLQERIVELNSSLTQKSTIIKSLESKALSTEESRRKYDQQILTLKQELKSVSDIKSSLERRVKDSETKLVAHQSSTSDKVRYLESETVTLQNTIQEKSSQLTQLEEEFEEERRTSAALRVQIDQLRENARKMSRSFKDANGFMEQLQSEVIQKVVEDIVGRQKVMNERFSEVKSEYEGVLTGIEAIKLESHLESVKTRRKREIRSKQTKESKQTSRAQHSSFASISSMTSGT
jgi:chromosome segregation ATPase